MIKNTGLLLLLYLCCCNNHSKKIIDKEIVVSTEKEKLKQLIALEQFNPISVQFSYRTVVPSDSTDRLPGPTDYRLEAVLYYKISDRINRRGCSPFEQTQFSRDDFNFSWLPEEIKNELREMPVNSRGNNASCFYKGVLMHGSCFYFRDKILLVLFTN